MDEDSIGIVRIAEQLAIVAIGVEGDGTSLDGDVIRAGMAQLGELLGDSLALSGASTASATFGLDVDVSLGAVVVTAEGAGVLTVTLTWDTEEVLFDLFDDEDLSEFETGFDDVDNEDDEDDEYEFDEVAEDE